MRDRRHIPNLGDRKPYRLQGAQGRLSPRTRTLDLDLDRANAMPRTAGVSPSSRLRFILFSPSPIKVARWSFLRPIGLAICVTLSFVLTSATTAYSRASTSRRPRISLTFLPRRLATERGELELPSAAKAALIMSSRLS